MATPLTNGRLFLIESDSGNQDWITNNSGDPDLIDLDNFTEGTNYAEMDFPLKYDKRLITGAAVPPSPGGAVSSDERDKARYYIVNITGTISTRAKALLLDKFLMSDAHTSGTSGIFKRYHLIIYFGTNDHEKFTDANGDRQSYCTGVISPDCLIQFDSSKALVMNANMTFKSVWSK